MLVLYHGGTSVASAKVRLALSEKRVPFESRLLDLRAGEQKSDAYLSVNPAGVVPTLVHDGRVIVESSIILEYVDETWPAPALMPAAAAARAEVRLWLRRIDDLHDACSILSSSVKLAGLRNNPTAAAALLARTPDAGKRARQQRLIEQGFAAPDVDAAIARYAEVLKFAGATLSQADWLSGATFGLADCAALPYLHRLSRLGMEALWANAPRVSAWIERARARGSFHEAITRWDDAGAFAPSRELAARAAAFRAPR